MGSVPTGRIVHPRRNVTVLTTPFRVPHEQRVSVMRRGFSEGFIGGLQGLSVELESIRGKPHYPVVKEALDHIYAEATGQVGKAVGNPREQARIEQQLSRQFPNIRRALTG